MGESHLVVDGSNIATEGRSLPSLQQLLDAVGAVSDEFDYDHVTVIVDATFGHRIDKSERDEYDEHANSGQIITPPAGVIGRGDAFILEVADRADAVILSNDSFQEFHGTYDWLFDEGRLVGGKHVPGVGWIFLPRSPVRGPTSRRAVSDAKRKRRGSKKAPAPKQTSTRPAAKSSGRPKKAKAPDPEKKDAGRKRGGKEPEPYNEPLPFIEFVGAHPVGSVIEAEVEQFASHGAYVVCDGTRCYISLKSISDPPPRSARDALTLGETREFVVHAIDTPRRGIDLTMPGFEAPADDGDVEDEPDTTDAPESPPAETTGRARGGSGGRSRTRSRSRDDAPAAGASADDDKVAQPTSQPTSDGPARRSTTAAAAADASDDDGDKKLSVSQRRKLRARQEAEAAEQAAADKAPARTGATKRSATKKAGTKKAGTKKAPAKKAVATRAGTKRAATKKAGTTKAGTTKAPATKTATKKAPAKTSVTKRAGSTKAGTTKAGTTKAPAKKTATKKAPAKKAASKKAVTKRAGTKKTAAKRATTKKSATGTSTAARKAPAKKASSTTRSTATKAGSRRTSAAKKASPSRADEPGSSDRGAEDTSG